ncbi:MULTISPECIES: hypothetical protein [unclassified Microcoleus]|uniref:hypothetical protein n=1 Tax=unclassified Microcoleus TaxID=2642155 RepID=UPI002FD16DE1
MADSKIIVARPRFGGYIISEKPCYKHERWVDSQVKANKKVATVAEFFGNGISCKPAERSREPSCKCSPGYLWQLAKNAVLRQQRFFQSLPE